MIVNTERDYCLRPPMRSRIFQAMKMTQKPLVARNIEWLMEQRGLNTNSLAEEIQKRGQVAHQGTIFRISNGESSDPRTSSLQPIADFFGVTVADLRARDFAAEGMPSANSRQPLKIRTLVSADETDEPVGEIPYWDAKGSCGGGALNWEEAPRGTLVKEASFFKRYDLKPANAVAIYADGNSMADFIVDGDIVIFDRTKIEPKSGKIFLIDHPDGLRIKQMRRHIDGSWVLESRNLDKRQYPDEVVPESQSTMLKIVGEFVYRQGG